MSAVTPYRIATIEGDGIGPEVTQGAMRVLTEACGAGVLDFVMLEGGAGSHVATGEVLPAETAEACRTHH
ncbi:MAG: isocitrate/isopropylmalate family dehydrogenase, partial [Aurantimonas coralicida]